MTEPRNDDASAADSEGAPTTEPEHQDAPERERERPTPGLPRVVIAVVVVPVLGFALLLATGLARDPHELPSQLVAKRAPEFSLPRLGERGRVELESLRGQVVVLNFWASWCLACRDEHPDLLAAWERYGERGVVLVGIDFEDTEEAALAYAREMGGDWPLVSDPSARAAIAYGVFGVPETFVIAPDGMVTAKHVGAVTYAWLTREIEAALRKQDAP